MGEGGSGGEGQHEKKYGPSLQISLTFNTEMGEACRGMFLGSFAGGPSVTFLGYLYMCISK